MNINNLSYQKLIKLRLCDLNLSIQDSCVSKQFGVVLNELGKRGFLYLKPKIYIGDEWFSPSGTLSISIPFYLFNKRLRELEKKHTGNVEGGTDEWCLRLLRHEIGHCFDHAYEFSKTSEWKKIFGNPRKKYDPDNYSFDPTTRDYVKNLEDCYAQAHPDEDFAETFAVWLKYSKKQWKYFYRSSPLALQKLLYIDKITSEVKSKIPKSIKYDRMCDIRRLKRSLEKHYFL